MNTSSGSVKRQQQGPIGMHCDTPLLLEKLGGVNFQAAPCTQYIHSDAYLDAAAAAAAAARSVHTLRCVTKSIYVTSTWFSLLSVGHETKEFDQISIIMGISSPGSQTNWSLTSASTKDHLWLLSWL